MATMSATTIPQPERPPLSVEHIEMTPGVCRGRPRIAGTRIKVQHVVIWHERMGMSVSEIVATYPQLALADVHAALAYYHDHREQILADMKADEEFVAEMRAKTPSILQQKLAERHAKDDSLPPG
jgi:uncharacterized protein (DUF433 family)